MTRIEIKQAITNLVSSTSKTPDEMRIVLAELEDIKNFITLNIKNVANQISEGGK